MRVSLGIDFVGASNCYPDTTHSPSTFDGAVYRIGRTNRQGVDPNFMSEFKSYVARWLRQNLTPLDPLLDYSVKGWLERSNYTMVRRGILEEVDNTWRDFMPDIFRTHISAKSMLSFAKDEPHTSFKYPRVINSRSDIFKVYFAPILTHIEHVLNRLVHFVKNVPVDERPEYLLKHVHQEGAWILGTDFTSFEASFIPELMKSCELQLYEYMTQMLTDTEWIDIVTEVLTGTNVCKFRDFIVSLLAKRMSGEMCTATGNGFTNLMAIKFCCHKAGTKSPKEVVEGDDGIISGFGPKPTKEMFAKLGLDIKLVEYEGVTLGSFCGMVMDPYEKINITDPIEVLLSAGWTTREYRNSRPRKLLRLLKCKGYSYLYQYTGCPIIDSLARYILRVTKEVDYLIPNSANAWQRDKIKMLFQKYQMKLPSKTCGILTRNLMEKQFKVTVHNQILSEVYLDGLDQVQQIDMPWLMVYINEDRIIFYHRYCFHSGYREIDFIGANHRLKRYISATTLFDQYVKN